MGAADLLKHLGDAGLKLTADGNRLIVSPTERLTDGLMASIRAHKAVLLAALSASNAGTPSGLLRAGVDDDRLTCASCKHFRAGTQRCSNYLAAGMPRDLGPDLSRLPQRCPGFAAVQYDLEGRPMPGPRSL